MLDSLRSVVTPTKEDDLETILLRMTGVGQPRVSLCDGGWYCAVDLTIAVVGASMKVASDFGCKSPIAAAKQCEERIKETVRKFGGS